MFIVFNINYSSMAKHNLISILFGVLNFSNQLSKPL